MGRFRTTAGRKPNKSWMVFAYSFRLKRLNLLRPSFCSTLVSQSVNSPFAHDARTFLSAGARGFSPFGGIVPDSICSKTLNHNFESALNCSSVRTPERLTFPFCFSSPWHLVQCAESTGITLDLNAVAASSACVNAGSIKWNPNTMIKQKVFMFMICLG